MSAKSTIEWTDATWNPVRGCSRVSQGCVNCYAERQAARFSGQGKPFDGFVRIANGHPQWTGSVELVDKHLLDPLKWREPKRIFVNSMSDLFHEGLPDEAIDHVFAVMALCPQHIFQVLTKRPERMRAYVNGAQYGRMCDIATTIRGGSHSHDCRYPLSNLWLGISCEDQPTADKRIPELLRTPAAIHFVSYEPALEAVDFRLDEYCLDTCAERRMDLHWIIVGGESGPGARPFDIQWARNVVDQCGEAGVACFVKQLGANPISAPSVTQAATGIKLGSRKGGDMEEWPADLRVRRFPEER